MNMFVSKPKVIAIVGPTSSGKTALGIYLAQKIGGEIISADSRQVYKGLDIGTGKVTKKEMAGITHHLLDVASPKKIFSASDFKAKAEKAIQTIIKNGNVPIIVGGTGLYVDVLLGRMVLPDVPPNEKLRVKLEKMPVEKLFEMLQKLDPTRAATIEPKHARRIIRAIEIAKALGKNPLPSTENQYDVLWLGLNPAEKILEKKIHDRLLSRIKSGMIPEAKKLHANGLSYKRMEALGLEYRSLSQFLQKKITKEEMIETLEREIRKYAKRQMRWFKANKNIIWVKNKTEALQLAKSFVFQKNSH